MTTFLVISALAVAVLFYLNQVWSAPDLSHFDHPEDPLVVHPDDISEAHETVVSSLRKYHRRPATRDIHAGRRHFEDFFATDVEVDVRPADAGGVPAEWVLAEGADPDTRLLYIHGGAFMVGSPKSHRFLTSEISKRSGAAVLSIDYRMLPEFKTIHCHEDAQTAYRWILENGPDTQGSPKHLFVAGDSAGGNLTLSVIAWARNNDVRAADGAIALAPLTDGTWGSPTWKQNIATDHFLGPSIGRLIRVPSLVRKILQRLQGGQAVNHPQISPLLGHLGNLPATLIQVSRQEMLYGDAQRYANKARHEGSEVTLQVWPKLVHVFQGFGVLPEAHDALDRIAIFMNEKISANQDQQPA